MFVGENGESSEPQIPASQAGPEILSDRPENANLKRPTVGSVDLIGDYDETMISRLGPGALFEAFARCERIVERLKLLNYEREFVPLADSFKVIPRHYFAQSTNIGEQFFLFTSLAVWLIRKAKLAERIDMPHEFDDPNTIISNILNSLKTAGIDIQFSASKLKPGSGPQCIFVLDQLVSLALAAQHFTFSKIEAVKSDENDVELEDGGMVDDGTEDIEITAEQFEEDENEIIAAVDEEDSGHLVTESLPLHQINNTPIVDANGADRDGDNRTTGPLKSILNTFTDPAMMTAELRRVIPQLKITIRSGTKDWKMHVEQMEKYEGEIDTQFRETVRPFLAQNAREIGDAMERISSRETHLNTQFEHLMHTFRLRQNEFAAVSERYRESSGTLNDRAETLNNLNEEIEQIKQQIEEQGIRNTNGTPILKIKQSLAKLENAIFTMRVQIVVAEQALIQSQLSDRLNLGSNVRDTFS